ncbi:MAG: peptidase M64, partial [Alistipes sp.]|nr:peptidase M64 [Alistipes sp.]
EPWEPNITTLVDFSSKWGDLIPAEVEQPTVPTEERKAAYTVGLYDGGGSRTRGVYRPAVVCRMRDNQADRVCPVCERALERVIRHQTEAEKE